MSRPGRTAPSPIRYPSDLPITERRAELLTTIGDNQVVVVAGETGSGKSTQLPKLCLELGRGVDGWIGHTQPRRIAARAVAERVAEELGVELGTAVGYAVRFTDRVGSDTLVKVMTDGILLAEIQRDRTLSRYDTIIIDEAHERSLNIDFLLGFLKDLLPRRRDLKVIITSATIDTQRFSAHFDDAPIVEVSGRTHPVEIRYRPYGDEDDSEARDQTQAICDAALELRRDDDGDILVFCSGEREIRDAVDALGDLGLRDTEIVPLYGRLSAAEQHRVFAPHRGRRIVVATNVAETSLTVPGIRTVIDAGTARISRYNRRTKVQRLPIEAISQASANQRSGRCGRLGPGIAIRLYSEEDFENRPEFTDPEIQRTSLASVILQMAAIGIGPIETFPFLDPPDHRSIRDGVALLHELGALEPGDDPARRRLTPVGRKLARLPVDPRLGRMLLAAGHHGCVREVLVIAAGLSIQDPRERPTDARAQADQLHARFADTSSDFMSLLHLWTHLESERRGGSSSRFRRTCRREFLNYLRIREWQDLRAQLRRVAKSIGLEQNETPAEPDQIHQALLHGLLSQVGTRHRDTFEYRGTRGTLFAVAPGSAQFKARPRWVMAAELVETNRLWARTVAPVKPEWLERIGAHVVSRSHSDPWWDPARGCAVTNETVSLYGLTLAADRTVPWERVDEGDAHDLFVFHALARGDWDRRHDFVDHNRSVLDEAAALETRLRRGDLVVDLDTLADWFDQRVPDHITSATRFDRWWARLGRPDTLDLTLDDVLRVDPDTLDDDAFPEVWHHGDLGIELAYANDPTTTWDGVTVDIPVGALGRIDATTFEWQVPGFRNELIEALIRSMPKALRTKFVPIPTTVEAISSGLDPAQGGLHEALREALSRYADIVVPPDAFDVARIPNHLRPSFRIIGDDGGVIAEGTDLDALKELLRDHVRETLAASSHELERTGMTTWDIGSLPRTVETAGPGHTVVAYPALVDAGDSVAVRVLATSDEQAEAMWNGLRRLLLLNRPSVSKALRSLLTEEAKLALVHGPYDGPAEWFDDLLQAAVDQLMLDSGAPVWDATAFDALLGHVRHRLPNMVTDIGRASAAVLSDLRAVRAAAATLPPPFAYAAADVDEQIERLVYPGFLTGLGGDRLADVRRYLQAIEHRLARIPENPARDADTTVRVRALEAELDRIATIVPVTPDVEDAMWMLQELRVSLFAQPIGARGNVSETRVRRRLAELLDPR